MRWLLKWLHPDHNHNSWDAVYAERVLKAWREVSAANGSVVEPLFSRARVPSNAQKREKHESDLAALDRIFCQQSVTGDPKFLSNIYDMGGVDWYRDHFFGSMVSPYIPSALSR